MDEVVFFKGLATKGLSPINSSERYFEGYLTVQIKDKQGEVTIVDELMKVLPVWIDRGAPISDTHSNRIIGKGINYAKVEYKDKDGELYPAIKITGKIHKNYELDTDIWTKIKSGEYKGLSFGGATKSDREPMRMKDGSIAYSLKDLEHYEVAVCRDPAVPLALITDFNPLAKATTMGEDIGNGRMMIKCDKFGCYVDKNNKEGGQIEPALAHEETVRETKTHNPKSMDHPIELETKGESDEATDKLIRAVKDPKKRKDLIDRQTAQETSAQDAAEATSDRADKDAKKGAYVDKITPVSEAYMSHLSGKPQKGDQKPYCPSCGRSHVAEDKKVHQGYKDTHEGSEPTLMGIPSCPNCGHGDKKKGEDWSNADGDLHSGMYNQNTDEGGMGKHKEKGCKCGDPKCKDPKCKHKREVGTGYGAEQNAEGEVQWQGSGSPYPKKKGYSDDAKEGGFIHDQLRHHTTEAGKREHEEWKKRQPKEYHEGVKREAEEFNKRKKKRKSIITNIYSRLKSLDFLLRDAPKATGREAKPHDTPPNKTDWKLNQRSPQPWNRRSDEDRQSHAYQSTRERARGMIEDNPRRVPKQDKNHLPIMSPTKRKATITNVHSRLKNIQTRIGISDFLLRKGDDEEKREHQEKREQKRNMFVHGDFSGRPDKMTPTPEQIANKKIRDEKEAKIAADKKERQSRGGRAAALNRKKKVDTIEINANFSEIMDKVRGAMEEFNKPKKKPKDEKEATRAAIKEGEFGGMNTGEAEWTEPRQTANDRKDRKEKSEEGYGQSMLNGAQRGSGHEGGIKNGSGQSAQVTEVKEEKDKSAYENSEQDGSNKKQIPHSNVDTTKTTNI